MNRDNVIAILRTHEGELRHRGVAHAALFGSTARGDERAGSDLDILVDIAPEAEVSLYGYVGIVQFIASLFSGPVDVVERDALLPSVRQSAEREAVLAF